MRTNVKVKNNLKVETYVRIKVDINKAKKAEERAMNDIGTNDASKLSVSINKKKEVIVFCEKR